MCPLNGEAVTISVYSVTLHPTDVQARAHVQESKQVFQQQHCHTHHIVIIHIPHALIGGAAHLAVTEDTSPELSSTLTSCTSCEPRILPPKAWMRSMSGAKSSSATLPLHQQTSKLF